MRLYTVPLGLLHTALLTVAQAQTISISPSARLRLADIGGGQSLIVAENRFGFDSSRVEVMQADAAWTVTPLAARKFPDPLWFLFDAAPTTGGMVVAGTLTSSYVPQLHKVNSDGTLAWAMGFSGMNASQTRVAQIFGNGSTFTGYTNADSFGGDAMYRVEGDDAGSTFAFRRVTTSDGLYFRMYCGAATDDPSNHLLGGSGMLSGTAESGALLGHFSSAGATWLKHYELGSVSPQQEEVNGVVRLVGGGYGVAMHSQDSPGVLVAWYMQVDDNGNVMNCTKLTHQSSMLAYAITQLDDGSVLIGGSTMFGAGMLIKLTPNGTLLWARECATCIYASINSFRRNAANELQGLGPGQVYQLSPDGDACGFLPVTTVSASSFTPVVTDLTPVNDTLPAVTAAPMTMLERSPNAQSAVLCDDVGVAEEARSAALACYPVPTHDRLFLRSDVDLLPSEQVEVWNAIGERVLVTRYGQGIDLATLPTGTYLVRLPRSNRTVRVVKT